MRVSLTSVRDLVACPKEVIDVRVRALVVVTERLTENRRTSYVEEVEKPYIEHSLVLERFVHLPALLLRVEKRALHEDFARTASSRTARRTFPWTP